MAGASDAPLLLGLFSKSNLSYRILGRIVRAHRAAVADPLRIISRVRKQKRAAPQCLKTTHISTIGARHCPDRQRSEAPKVRHRAIQVMHAADASSTKCRIVVMMSVWPFGVRNIE
jgi:hypothetical protein